MFDLRSPLLAVLFCMLCLAAETAHGADEDKPLRPPAVPLVVIDPYFSTWSFDDNLYDSWPKHWTGEVHAMTGLLRVDGRTWRFMGTPKLDAQPAAQTALEVHPTRTIYRFAAGGVELQLTFLTPALPDDLDSLSLPVTFLQYDVRSTDGKEHEAAIYFDASGEWVVDKVEQPVVWNRVGGVAGLEVLRIGSKEQPVLQKKGDNLRIDWGWLYLAVPKGEGLATVIAGADGVREAFARDGSLPPADDKDMPRPARKNWPVLACAMKLGRVGSAAVSRRLILAYDDEYSIQYMGRNLRPWWRRKGADAKQMLHAAAERYPQWRQRCEAFDRELTADLQRVGGRKYAELCALAYRQCLGAHKLTAGPDGQMLYFSKENFSNGCIATVDVTYPSAPMFMLLSNDLLKGLVRPVLDYALSPRWKFPFAPHDLGKYPQANGQVYGGGETSEKRQMPVEECGNLLILAAAICRIDGGAAFVEPYWPVLEKWAAYLKQYGLDPAEQLCTDDFAGHLARNCNLSLKAIEALGAYAQLLAQAGRKDAAAAYRATAEAFARQWMTMADDGGHYRLAFDKAGTWSQKYNLVWDRLLGLNLFPPQVARKEVAYYKTKLNPFGLPLDNRQTYTKTDWEVWTATLAETREDFDALMNPVYAFVNHTEPRAPLTDWYFTDTAKLRGFRARSVVGGLFIKMLADEAVWTKWSARKQP